MTKASSRHKGPKLFSTCLRYNTSKAPPQHEPGARSLRKPSHQRGSQGPHPICNCVETSTQEHGRQQSKDTTTKVVNQHRQCPASTVLLRLLKNNAYFIKHKGGNIRQKTHVQSISHTRQHSPQASGRSTAPTQQKHSCHRCCQSLAAHAS